MRFRHRLLCALAGLVVAGSVGVGCASDEPDDDLKERVRPCTHCHGAQGRAAADGYYPRLAGKPALYLHQQLLHFRDGRRRYAPMSHLIGDLSDAYLFEMARYFAALDLPYPAPRRGDATALQFERGRALTEQGDPSRKIPACRTCHGTALTGVLPATPGLLGLPRDYLSAQLGAWKSGQRRALAPDCMADIARALTPEDIGAVAAWLASQPVPADAKPVYALARKPEIACGSFQAVAPMR